MAGARLSPTQSFILRAAAKEADGSFIMGAGDRDGTRVVGRDDFGRIVIVAYQTPEFFLKGRGLIESYGNGRFTYRITDQGRALVGRWVCVKDGEAIVAGDTEAECRREATALGLAKRRELQQGVEIMPEFLYQRSRQQEGD